MRYRVSSVADVAVSWRGKTVFVRPERNIVSRDAIVLCAHGVHASLAPSLEQSHSVQRTVNTALTGLPFQELESSTADPEDARCRHAARV